MEFMNEKDLRDCFAMFTLCGIVMRGIDDEIIEDVAINAYKMADAMLEARNKENNEELGIAAVKPKRRYPKRPSDL
jgi:hypothetical protein